MQTTGTEGVHNVVIRTPFGDWHVQVRGLKPAEVAEAAVAWVLKRDPRLGRHHLSVL